jgi:orotate phosphoribosyltransferase
MVCVVDREEGGRENLEKEGVRVTSLVKASELLGYKP